MLHPHMHCFLFLLVFAVSLHADPPVLHDLTRRGTADFSYDLSAVTRGHEAFFVAKRQHQELWRTDGTAAGTWRIREIPLDFETYLSMRFVSNGVVYFQESTPGLAGWGRLWRTDGTEAGTFVVCECYETLPVPGGVVVTDHQNVLWAGDGTRDGWRKLTDQAAGLRSAGKLVIFTRNGVQWRTDGTAAGTGPAPGYAPAYDLEAVLDTGTAFYEAYSVGVGGARRTRVGRIDRQTGVIVPLGEFERGVQFASVGDTVYVAVRTPVPYGQEPSTIVMRIEGDALVPALRVEASVRIYATSSHLFLGSDDTWWRSDGTQRGTVRIGSLKSGWAVTTSARLFFKSSAGLYVADGTSPLTQLSSGGGFGSGLTTFGERVLFTWSTPDEGTEIWLSDGTPAGTRMLRNIGFDGGSNPVGAVPFGENVLFHAGYEGARHRDERAIWIAGPNGTRFITAGFDEYDLLMSLGDGRHGLIWSWRWLGGIDSTSGETRILSTHEDFRHWGRLQWAGKTAVLITTRALWRTDGTPEGTVRVQPWGWSWEDEPVEAGSLVYVNGNSIWRTDGTAAGTFIIGPRADAIGRWGTRLAVVRNRELFVTDGVSTRRVGKLPQRPWRMETAGDMLFLLIGREVWSSDGTTIERVAQDIAFQQGAALGSMFFFTADDPVAGRELWRSDGTQAGTRVAFDLAPGRRSSDPTALRRIGNRIYFSATDGVHGREAWWTDGTRVEMIADLEPGLDGSDPDSFTPMGSGIFFVAGTQQSGREPWTWQPGREPARQRSVRK